MRGPEQHLSSVAANKLHDDMNATCRWSPKVLEAAVSEMEIEASSELSEYHHPPGKPISLCTPKDTTAPLANHVLHEEYEGQTIVASGRCQ